MALKPYGYQVRPWIITASIFAALFAGGLAVMTSSLITSRAGATARSTERPWPGGELRILDQSGQPVEVERAIRRISRVGLVLKLRLVDADDDPQLIIRRRSSSYINKLCPGCDAIASSIGYRGQDEEIMFSGDGLDRASLTELITHEVGHILGLEHTADHCSVMQHNLAFDHCSQRQRWFRCGLQSYDVNRLINLGYMRHERPYRPWCSMATYIKDVIPTELTANNIEVLGNP